ncbi:hypothetical protein [Sphingomonas sp. UYP23]
MFFGIAAGVDLGGDPRILLLGKGNGFTHGRHVGLYVNHTIGAI